MIDLSLYRTFVFDCDGVILNSNKTKSDAFRAVISSRWPEHTEAFLAHHRLHGGISRHEKFNYFLSQICQFKDQSLIDQLMSELLADYSSLVVDSLLRCEVSPQLTHFCTHFQQVDNIVVSGGDQYEIRSVFKSLNISHLFNRGIFGSPDSKEVILSRELANLNIIKPAIFFGDSSYDFHVAQLFGLDFIFISQWTDLPDWSNFVDRNHLSEAPTLSALLSS